MPSFLKMQNPKEKTSWLFVFMTGFVIGVLLINFWDKSESIQEGLVSIYTIERLKSFEIDSGKFLIYVLEERLKAIFFMTLLATTVAGVVASYAFIGWIGISLGILLTVMTIRFGLKGTFLFAGLVLPQYIIYVPAFMMFVNWCFKLCIRIHFPHRNYDTIYGNKKQQFLHFFVQLIIIIGVVIIGAFVECYVNPIFLNKIVKLF